MLEVNYRLRDCIDQAPTLVDLCRELIGKDYRGFLTVKPLGIVAKVHRYPVYGWTVVGIPGSGER